MSKKPYFHIDDLSRTVDPRSMEDIADPRTRRPTELTPAEHALVATLTNPNRQRAGTAVATSTGITVTEYAPVLADAGVKHDGGKPAMHLIPPEAVEALAQVLGFGATKYEARNWERGLLYSRVFSAAMRHLWAWWRGDNKDPETGFSHLDHALTCVAFLVSYERRGMESFDDRAKDTP